MSDQEVAAPVDDEDVEAALDALREQYGEGDIPDDDIPF